MMTEELLLLGNVYVKLKSCQKVLENFKVTYPDGEVSNKYYNCLERFEECLNDLDVVFDLIYRGDLGLEMFS